jgi:hypothetical protein
VVNAILIVICRPQGPTNTRSVPVGIIPPTPPPRTCTAVFTGVNSEGGGDGTVGANENTFNFGLQITGGETEYTNSIDADDTLSWSVSLTAEDFGGLSPGVFTAVYDRGTITWSDCNAVVDGTTYNGNVAGDSFDPGPVSVTTDLCTISFSCGG